MEFRVLGPVEVWGTGHRIDVGHAKQRSVLAVLLLDLGRVVPIDVLIDRVWGDSPPTSVRNNLYAYVARLRSVIADAGAGDAMLTRRSGGYVLEADAGLVDLYRFRDQVAEASTAPDPRAAELLGAALRLWRGPALAGLTSPWLRGMRETLEPQRIAALLDLGDIALRQGDHATVAGRLAREAVAHPTDERLIGQLMLALYRSGRQAEALRWYEQTRRNLADELGADPEPALVGLHQQILRSEPALAFSAGDDREPPAVPSRGLVRPGWPGRPAGWPRWPLLKRRTRPRPSMRTVVSVGLAITSAAIAGVVIGASLSGEGASTAARTTAISGLPPPVPIGPTCRRPTSPANTTVTARPRLCLSQARGDLFTVFTVRDSGFTPGTRVRLTLIFYPPPPPPPSPVRLPPVTLRKLTVAANGAVRLGRFQLGVYLVVASGPSGHRIIAVFQVLPPAAG